MESCVELDLQEEEVSAFPRGLLNADAAVALSSSGRFDVQFPSPLNNQCYMLRSRGWVGHIPAGSSVIVRVHPKAPVANLFRMLEVAYKLKSFDFFDGLTGVAELKDCFESLAAILARRTIDRARKGLVRAYFNVSESLGTVRGRIQPVRSARNIAMGLPKLHCDYQDLTGDTEDNQILLWTLHLLPRQGITRPEVQALVRKAHQALSGAVSLVEVTSQDCLGRTYHRLNEDYEPLRR